MSARVLVIEDDSASLRLVTYLLSQACHCVEGATDGVAGLLLARQNRFDLILCDLQLPGLGGFEILARLQNESAWRRVPVVAVSAYSMPGDRSAALAAGFDGYLTKPIDPDTFLADVTAFMQADARTD